MAVEEREVRPFCMPRRETTIGGLRIRRVHPLISEEIAAIPWSKVAGHRVRKHHILCGVGDRRQYGQDHVSTTVGSAVVPSADCLVVTLGDVTPQIPGVSVLA